MSYDSAYRRIRGEKSLTLEEIHKISREFNISLDSLLNTSSDRINFRSLILENEKFSLKDWLKGILFDLKNIKEASEKEIIYAAKDPPLFHYFQFPEIAAFKMFFYQKTLLRIPDFNDKKFVINETDPEILDIGKSILSISVRIPTTEIWNEDTFRISLRQIEYYWVAGYFEKKSDVVKLFDVMDKWISHIQMQAEMGFKFIHGTEAFGIEDSFRLYENEVVLNDNNIFIRTNNKKKVYIPFNVLNLLITSNEKICAVVENHMRGLLKDSVLISVSGNKERNRFFNKLHQIIDEFRIRILK